MSADQLATRVLAEQSGVNSEELRKGKISQSEFNSLARAAGQLTDLPLYIDDTPALSIAALRTRARRLKRQKGVGIIVVDYLQLLQGSAKAANENRVQEISEITRGLKTLAKELEVPVLALSQLSRAVENREDKRPQLADLRESGTIEQDADIVLFIYREEYYHAMKQPDEDDVAKYAAWQRAGRKAPRPRRGDRRQAAPRLDRDRAADVPQDDDEVQRPRERRLSARTLRVVSQAKQPITVRVRLVGVIVRSASTRKGPDHDPRHHPRRRARCGSVAVAQEAQSNGNPAVKDSAPHAVTAPARGHNRFTEGQAKKRLAKQGYTVTSLTKDASGAWMGMAMKDGKSVNVMLDYKGNVTTR